MITNSVFSNLTISSGLFQINQKAPTSNFRVLIENSIFANISLNSANNFDLIFINGYFDTIVISNTYFNTINYFATILKAINVNGTFILMSSFLENNFIVDNLINIENYFNFTAKDNIVRFSNVNNDGFYSKSGGSITLINGLFRNIYNLTIADCYSDKSILGLKIIDNANRQTYGAINFFVFLLIILYHKKFLG